MVQVSLTLSTWNFRNNPSFNLNFKSFQKVELLFYLTESSISSVQHSMLFQQHIQCMDFFRQSLFVSDIAIRIQNIKSTALFHLMNLMYSQKVFFGQGYGFTVSARNSQEIVFNVFLMSFKVRLWNTLTTVESVKR